MENIVSTRILSGFVEASIVAHMTSKRFGYWDKERSDLDLLAVIRSELFEAELAIKAGTAYAQSNVMPSHSQLEEELVDIVIRVLDFARGRDLNIGSAIVEKMEYNEALSRVGKGF